MIIELSLLNAIGQWLARGGFEDTKIFLNDFFNVDTAVIRARARELYGTTESRGEAEVSVFDWDPFPGKPPVFTTGGDSPTAQTLRAAPNRALSSLLHTVQDRWHGPAYSSFEKYSQALRDATRLEEERLREMGDVLVELADALEFTQRELTGLCVHLAGLLGFVGGILMAHPTSGRSLAAAAVGFVTMATGWLNTNLQNVTPRLRAIGWARLDLERIDAGSPLETLPIFPSDPDDWFVKTADPHN